MSGWFVTTLAGGRVEMVRARTGAVRDHHLLGHVPTARHAKSRRVVEQGLNSGPVTAVLARHTVRAGCSGKVRPSGISRRYRASLRTGEPVLHDAGCGRLVAGGTFASLVVAQRVVRVLPAAFDLHARCVRAITAGHVLGEIKPAARQAGANSPT